MSGQQAPASPPPQPPAPPPAPPPSPPEIDRTIHVKCECHCHEKPSPKWFRSSEFWTAVFTGLLVIVGAATAYVLIGQLGLLRTQIDDSENDGEISRQFQRRQIKALVSQAQNTRDSVAAGKAEAIIARKNTEQQLRALEAQAKSSQDSVAAIQEQMRIDQRAWIGMLRIEDVSFDEKDGLLATIIFENSGKTPATNVEFCNSYDLSDIPLHGPTPQDIKGLTGCGPSRAIAPQGTLKIRWGIAWSAQPITPAERQGLSDFIAKYRAIKDKKLFAYIFGTIKYDDAFSNRRETDFCFFIADPDKPQLGVCKNFNDIK